MTTITLAQRKEQAIPAILQPAAGGNGKPPAAKPVSLDKPRFIHLRPHVLIGADENGRDFYGGPKAKGGLTIAYSVEDAVDPENNISALLVRYAVAQCNELDVFCKATARAKSSGRLRGKSIKNAHQRGEFMMPTNSSVKDIDIQLRNKVVAKYNLDFNVF
jgi:hypothetical protein